MERIVFGPVPSRRLGQSLGINNIPPKICSYSCLYCQIGRTVNISTERKEFYPVKRIVDETGKILDRLRERKEKVDYITFVPDGESTLDINLGQEIRELKKFGLKIAVITNASLLWQKEVRADVVESDLVSVKIDAFDGKVWEKINRPAEELNHKKILEGIKQFRTVFSGTFLTETLLVRGINDSDKEITDIAVFISDLKPSIAFIGIPTRPPAENWVFPPEADVVNRAYVIFTKRGINTELILAGGATTNFGYTGDIESDILHIVSVHPMSHRQVEELLKKAGRTWETMEKLLSQRKVKAVEYQGERYYLKDFTH